MPPELFSASKMGEIAEEAMRVGAVTPGFFYDAVYYDDGQTVTCSLPYLMPGIGIVNDSGTVTILENIIRSRYGAERRVVIESCEDAAERTEARLSRHAEEAERIYRETIEKSAAERRARAEAEAKAREEELAAQPTRVTSLTAGVDTHITHEGKLLRVGTTLFDTEGAEPLYGDPFPIDAPSPLVSVTDTRNDILFLCTVFSHEQRANRAGDRITHTVSVTDGTSSLQIKKSGSPEDVAWIEESRLLTLKPIIYVANISEGEVSGDYESNDHYLALKAHAESEGSEIIAVSAQIEAELAALDGDEKEMFLSDLGIEESGLDKLIKSSYSLLGLISFLTAGPKEVRAWTIKKGTKAPGAAGKIHTDFERGFIRAEVVAFDDLTREGDRNKVKEKGLLRSEGKEYVMKDGDVVEFLFNV